MTYKLLSSEINNKKYFLTVWLAIQFSWIIYLIFYVNSNGYLPEPFIYDKADTFMDFFHTLQWTNNDGRYTEWHTVYPGLNFLFLKIISMFSIVDINQDGFLIRDQGIYFIYTITISYILLPLSIVLSIKSQIFNLYEKTVFYLISLTSAPMLFGLERGNLIIFMMPIIVLLLNERNKFHPLLISILINIKPYMALVGLVQSRDIRSILNTGLLTVTIFFFVGFFVDENFLYFFYNLFNFTQTQDLFSVREMLALPSSIAVYSAILRNPSIPELFYSISNNDIALLVDIIRLSTLIGSIVILIFTKNGSHALKVAVTLVLVMNIGVWVGGYTAVFLLPLIPFLIDSRFRILNSGLISVYCCPLDVVQIFCDQSVLMDSYVSGSQVLVYWSLTLGAILRPVLSFLLLITLSYELLNHDRK